MEHTSPPSGPRIVRYTEPTEAAFSLQLPEGWHVEGGVARGSSDPRPWYRVVSPGRGAELRGSDPRVPPSFLQPSFAAMGMMMPAGDAGVAPVDAGTMMGPRACTTPADCNGACPPGSRGCTCATTPMGQRCVPTCTVTADCPAGPAGVAFTCRMGTCVP